MIQNTVSVTVSGLLSTGQLSTFQYTGNNASSPSTPTLLWFFGQQHKLDIRSLKVQHIIILNANSKTPKNDATSFSPPLTGTP